MKYELKITLFFLLTLFLTKNVLSQVSVTKSNVDFTLTLKQDSVYRILTFWKEKDSEIYTSVKYTVSDFSKLAAEKNLSDEIETINQLWIFSLDSIETDLQSFNIGYPLLYSDILNNQIQAFLNSDEWQKHVKSEGKNLDYKLLHKIMLESNVYKPLNDFLNSKGYAIENFETEKHGFLTKENLLKAGFTGSEIIPMPFIVWVKLIKN